MPSTFAQLKERARQRADMEGSDFVTPEELAVFVNDSAAELYDILVASFQDYYLVSTTVTVLEGQDSVALPADFYKVRGVDRQLSGNTWSNIDPFSCAPG